VPFPSIGAFGDGLGLLVGRVGFVATLAEFSPSQEARFLEKLNITL